MHERVGDHLAREQLDRLDDLVGDRVVLEHVTHEPPSRAHHAREIARESFVARCSQGTGRARSLRRPASSAARRAAASVLAGLVGEPAQLDRVALGLVGFAAQGDRRAPRPARPPPQVAAPRDGPSSPRLGPAPVRAAPGVGRLGRSACRGGARARWRGDRKATTVRSSANPKPAGSRSRTRRPRRSSSRASSSPAAAWRVDVRRSRWAGSRGLPRLREQLRRPRPPSRSTSSSWARRASRKPDGVTALERVVLRLRAAPRPPPGGARRRRDGCGRAGSGPRPRSTACAAP